MFNFGLLSSYLLYLTDWKKQTNIEKKIIITDLIIVDLYLVISIRKCNKEYRIRRAGNSAKI